MSDYRPIPCAQHERLEFAALTKQWLEVTIGGGMAQRLLPLDVYTHDGAEWLKAENERGEAMIVRLDRLTF